MSGGYREDVLKDYHSKRSNGSLSPNLVAPTPASIRDECLLVFKNKRNKEDMNILRLFVEERESAEDYERALRITEVGIFKPLANFLKKPTIKTTNKNVELLAWLTDFNRHPFKPAVSPSDDRINLEESVLGNILKSQELSEEEVIKISGGQNTHSKTSDDVEDKATKKNNVKPGRKYRGAIIALSVAITVAMGSFIYHEYSPECMYWNGHNYVAAECDVIVPASDVIALEESALQNLKWITDADTISAKHINKIWYIRNDNMVELFTSGGQYPLDRKRRLFLMSKTIFKNYVATKKVRVQW
jgi:hypothetical protein